LKVLSSGNVWSGTVTKKKKDGSLIICESKLSPLIDENGKTRSYIDILRDVTKQKETEAKLKIQRQLNERILATMPEGVIVVDDDNRILLANKAFRHIFQINRKSTQYKALSEIIHKEQLLKNYHAVKQGEKASCTLEFRHKLDDIEKVIACNIIEMDGGQTLLTFTDISKEREEEEKLYLTDRLASIGEMAAGLAHELNNPLTGVLALSQLLIDSDIREEYKEDLRCVFEEARRAADIVKNVLLFARNNNYENGQASVNEVLNSVLRLREYEEKVSNITVVKELQEDLPDVTIDKFQLQQVFLNIILNAEAAIRDTRKPGKLIVQTERVNNHIHISFKDNGCGIKKTVISRIFDPFFTTKEIGKGTGLGLSICYGIVVKNGGRINVQSQVNEGTTFTVRMPVASSKRTGKKE
jgi:two-component system NtrC family sensor kinase